VTASHPIHSTNIPFRGSTGNDRSMNNVVQGSLTHSNVTHTASQSQAHSCNVTKPQGGKKRTQRLVNDPGVGSTTTLPLLVNDPGVGSTTTLPELKQNSWSGEYGPTVLPTRNSQVIRKSPKNSLSVTRLGYAPLCLHAPDHPFLVQAAAATRCEA
jgi:hypothetical protein